MDVEIGVIGCNFVVVNIGFFCLVMNEGNVDFVMLIFKI